MGEWGSDWSRLALSLACDPSRALLHLPSFFQTLRRIISSGQTEARPCCHVVPTNAKGIVLRERLNFQCSL